MLAFGGSLAINTVVFTGYSVPILILLNSYNQLAYEQGGGFVSENGTVTAPAVVDVGALPASSASPAVQNGTENNDEFILGFTKKECRKFIMVLAKRLLKILGRCSKQLKSKFPEADEYNKRFQCAIKCAMAETKMVDENMRISNATMTAFFEIQIPEKYHQAAWQLSTECINDWGLKVDPEDEFCTSYGDFVKCLQNKISIC